MAEIRLENVTKSYGARGPQGLSMSILRGPNLAPAADEENLQAVEGPIVALNKVNLTVPDGKTIAIVGPSGCGKSTLLRAVAGLTDYQGDVFYDGTNVNDVPVKNRRIGMVFQNYALYPHFLGRGNLDFFFQVHKRPTAEAEERIRITSEMMGIGFEELLKRKPGTLSGGQQQRVAIARAIVRVPELFLFDEPLSNLDAKLRMRTRSEIKRLLHRFGITALYVTHDQTEALALGDEIAVMRGGCIEQVGPYMEVRNHPVNSFVAGFLGSPPMNLIPGIVQQGALDLQGSGVPLPEPLKASSEGSRLTMGIHPEAILPLMGAPTPAPTGVRLTGVAEFIEPDYPRSLQTVLLRTGSFAYRAVLPIDVQVATGYEVEVIFPTDRLYFFASETGDRIYDPNSVTPA